MPRKEYAVSHNNVAETSNFKISSMTPFENTGATSSGAVVVEKPAQIENAYKLAPHDNVFGGTLGVNIAFGSAAEVATMANIEAGTKVILFGRQAAASTPASSHQDRFFYLNKKYSGKSDITVSITAINGDDVSSPQVTRQGGGNVTLSKPENLGNDILELQHSVDGNTWTTFKNIRPHDAGDGFRDLTFTEFRTVTTTFTPPSGQDVYIRVNQKNWAAAHHDHYAIKDLTVSAPFATRSDSIPINIFGKQIKSGFTTLNTRISQQIEDNRESDTYSFSSLKTDSRTNIGKNLRDPSFDDTLELMGAQNIRKEVLTFDPGNAVEIIDRASFFIRGADGKTFKKFIFVTSDRSSLDSFIGNSSPSDIKISIREELANLPAQVRNNAVIVTRAMVTAMAKKINEEKSLKIKATPRGNSIILEDSFIETVLAKNILDLSASPDLFRVPPRALGYPSGLLIFMGSDVLNSALGSAEIVEELHNFALEDPGGLVKRYTIVDAAGTSVPTGKILEAGDDFGSSTLSAGHALIGSVAVAANLTTSTLFQILEEIVKAIRHPNGHGSRVTVLEPKANFLIDSGVGVIELATSIAFSHVPPTRHTSSWTIVDRTGMVRFSAGSVGDASRPPFAQVDIGHTATENIVVELMTADGHIKKYISFRGDQSTLSTGDVVSEGDALSSGTNVSSANAGAIAFEIDPATPSGNASEVLATKKSQVIFNSQELGRAIMSFNGHFKRVKTRVKPHHPSVPNGCLVITDLIPAEANALESFPINSQGEIVFGSPDDPTIGPPLNAKIRITTADESGTETQKTYITTNDTLANGTVLAAGSGHNPDGAGNIVGGDSRIGMVSFRRGANAASAATGLVAAINSSAGHNAGVANSVLPAKVSEAATNKVVVVRRGLPLIGGVFVSPSLAGFGASADFPIVVSDATSGEVTFVRATGLRGGRAGARGVRKTGTYNSIDGEFGTTGVLEFTGTSTGGKIIEAILNDPAKVCNIEVVNKGGTNSSMTYGLNYHNNPVADAALAGHHRKPDLSGQSGLRIEQSLIKNSPSMRSGSIEPFNEFSIFESFSGEPGKFADLRHTRLTRHSEKISLKSEVGPGFEGSLSSKESITIEIDGRSSSPLHLYAYGSGKIMSGYPSFTAAQKARPNMAYLTKTGQWTALGNDLVYDRAFPKSDGTSMLNASIGQVKSSIEYLLTEKALLGFGQGSRNLGVRIGASPALNASGVELGSVLKDTLGYTDEQLEREKDKIVFIESCFNPCIDTFGFPSHPKYTPEDSMTIDMSDYIDSDFLVEHITVSCNLTLSGGLYVDVEGLDRKSGDPGFEGSNFEIKPGTATFFLLNERKAVLPTSQLKNSFALKKDTGSDNLVVKKIIENAYLLPGQYPHGDVQPWTRGNSPRNVIFDGLDSTAFSHTNLSPGGSSDAGVTGWSFSRQGTNIHQNLGFNNTVLGAPCAVLRAVSDMTIVSTNADHCYPIPKYTNATPATRSRGASTPSSIPLNEGIDSGVYLSTSEAYRLRFLANTRGVDNNGDGVADSRGGLLPNYGKDGRDYASYVRVHVNYLDKIEKGDASGAHVEVARVPIPLTLNNDFNWFDVPIKADFDGKGRKFNLIISFLNHQDDPTNPGSGDYSEEINIAFMEVYRVNKSVYVDTIRDVVSWGSVGVFPTDFDDKVGNDLATAAVDPRDHYASVYQSDQKITQDVVVSFPAKSPVRGNFSTHFSVGDSDSEDGHLLAWNSLGRSGLEGVPSDRSLVKSVASKQASFTTTQYSSKFPVSQTTRQSEVSPYMLKPSDKLVLGVQSTSEFGPTITQRANHNTIVLNPSRVTIKIYGTRLSNGAAKSSQTFEATNSDSCHQVIGDEPVVDQHETYNYSAFAGTYLDNIMFGNPNLVEHLRGGELVELGLGAGNFSNRTPFQNGVGYLDTMFASIAGMGDTSTITYKDPSPDYIGKRTPYGFGRYGNFNPFCTTITCKGTSATTNDANNWHNKVITITDVRNGTKRKLQFVSNNSHAGNSDNADFTTFNNGGPANQNDIGVLVPITSTMSIKEKLKRLRFAFEKAGTISSAGTFSVGPNPHDNMYVQALVFDPYFIDTTDSNADGFPDSGDRVAAFQIIPRIHNRAEADLYDAFLDKKIPDDPFVKVEILDPGGVFELGFSGMFEDRMSSSTHPLPDLAKSWNWMRKTKDFNRGVVARASDQTAGITGSIQPFVQLSEDKSFNYDTLVPTVYDFLSANNVVVPQVRKSPGNTSVLFQSGSFLPIFQRGQILGVSGTLMSVDGITLRSNNGEKLSDSQTSSPNFISFDKNIRNLWSRWVYEKEIPRTIDPLNPETFLVDTAVAPGRVGQTVTNFGTVTQAHSLEFHKAVSIGRVQFCDVNRLGVVTGSLNDDGTYLNSCHFTASLAGFGRVSMTHDISIANDYYGETQTSGYNGQFRGHPRIKPEDNNISNEPGSPLDSTQQAGPLFRPQSNENIRRATLKGLYGFETSFYSKVGTKASRIHDALVGTADLTEARVPGHLNPNQTFGPGNNPFDLNVNAAGDYIARARVVVRGMRYGIENCFPTPERVITRFNKYGQFRDMLEQRKFPVTANMSGTVNPERPVEIQFVSRPVFDDLGNVAQVRKFGVDGLETNSQNVSLFATASFPYFDEWDEAVPAQFRNGRDRSSVQNDNREVSIESEVF